MNANWKQLILKLKNFRNPLATNLRRPLYRAQAVRSIQALVRRDVSRGDFMLDPELLREPVIAKSGGQHGVLNLLALTRTKRLAILEWKATEDPSYLSRLRITGNGSGVTKPKATSNDRAIVRICNSKPLRQLFTWSRLRSVFTRRRRPSRATCPRTLGYPRGFGRELAARPAGHDAALRNVTKIGLSSNEGRVLPSAGFTVEFWCSWRSAGSREF